MKSQSVETTSVQTIALAEERAKIIINDVVTGKVTVRATTSSDVHQEVVDLARTETVIERMAVNRMLEKGEPAPQPRYEGDTYVVPVIEEVAVTEIRLLVKEELHIRSITSIDTKSIDVELRKQTATIERTGPNAVFGTLTRSREMSFTDDMSTERNSQQITAFFDTQEEAANAVRRIEAEGLSSSKVDIVAGRDMTATSTTTARDEDRGFFEALGDFFMPDEDKHTYAEGLNRGGYLVSVQTTAANRDRIIDILDDEGTIDMDQRETEWRNEGWDGGAAALAARSTAGVAPTAPYDTPAMGADEGTIEVMKENLRVGKRETDHGRVRIRSYVVETPVEEQVTLRDETVHVTRRPVDRAVNPGDGIFAERTVEATERHEEAVVSKEARVVEEISLETEASERTETVRDTLRHTEVEIDDERVAGDSAARPAKDL